MGTHPSIRISEKEIPMESNNANEAHLTVIVHGGKELEYTKEELVECLGYSTCSDNVPGWIMRSGYDGVKGMPKQDWRIKRLIQKLIDGPKGTVLNVRSDHRYLNGITFPEQQNLETSA